MESSKENKGMVIKQLYFYLVSFAALMMIAISSIVIVDTSLRMTVLSEADHWSGSFYMPGCDGTPAPQYVPSDAMPIQPAPTAQSCAQEKFRQFRDQEQQISRQHQRDLSWSLSMFAVSLPLFAIHWKLARGKKD
jgi:hypothetical protein